MPPAKVDPKSDVSRLDHRQLEQQIRKGLPSRPPIDHVPHAVGGVAVAVIEYVTRRLGRASIGHAFAAGWVIWESAEVILWLMETTIASGRQKEARRDGFRHELWKGFWGTNLALSQEVREAAFDRLVGDNRSHGVVPSLSPSAARERMEMVNAISDRWVTSLAAMRGLEEYVAKGPHTGEFRFKDPSDGMLVTMEVHGTMHKNEAGEYVYSRPEERKSASIAEAREKLEGYQTRMADDVVKVMDFDANPANWNLTDDQRAKLPAYGPNPAPTPAN